MSLKKGRTSCIGFGEHLSLVICFAEVFANIHGKKSLASTRFLFSMEGYSLKF